mmetsp:Transcript_2243/g.4033  ORF Transcript_2243/g.4033 Transcript_2243/m.4033 type:complete len:95 (+) Transcript_2243:1513-1797(+)
MLGSIILAMFRKVFAQCSKEAPRAKRLVDQLNVVLFRQNVDFEKPMDQLLKVDSALSRVHPATIRKGPTQQASLIGVTPYQAVSDLIFHQVNEF